MYAHDPNTVTRKALKEVGTNRLAVVNGAREKWDRRPDIVLVCVDFVVEGKGFPANCLSRRGRG